MTNVNRSERSQRTQGVSSGDKTQTNRASAKGLAEKLRAPPGDKLPGQSGAARLPADKSSRTEAATALLTTPKPSSSALIASLGGLGAQIAGFHETGRVRAPNPRAIDTQAMAANLARILDNAVPQLRTAIAASKQGPPELQQAARQLAVTLYDEKNAIEAWLWKYGGSSATLDLREERFGRPLELMQTFSDELKAAAAGWGGANASGGVDRLQQVVYGGKLLDQMRAKGKALDAALDATPRSKAKIDKAEAALLKVMQPLFAQLQDAAVMADAQSAIQNDYWQKGRAVADMARHITGVLNDSGLGITGTYRLSEHTRGWVDYAGQTMRNLVSQHMAVDFHQRGNPPQREPIWLDDPRIPDGRK